MGEGSSRLQQDTNAGAGPTSDRPQCQQLGSDDTHHTQKTNAPPTTEGTSPDAPRDTVRRSKNLRSSKKTTEKQATPVTEETSPDAPRVDGGRGKIRSDKGCKTPFGDIEHEPDLVNGSDAEEDATARNGDATPLSFTRLDRPAQHTSASLGAGASSHSTDATAVTNLVPPQGIEIQQILNDDALTTLFNSNLNRGDDSTLDFYATPGHKPFFTSAYHGTPVGLPPTIVDRRVRMDELSPVFDRPIDLRTRAQSGADFALTISNTLSTYARTANLNVDLSNSSFDQGATSETVFMYAARALERASQHLGIDIQSRANDPLFPRLRAIVQATSALDNDVCFNKPAFYDSLFNNTEYFTIEGFSADPDVWLRLEQRANQQFEALLEQRDDYVMTHFQLIPSDQFATELNRRRRLDSSRSAPDMLLLAACLGEATNMGYHSIGAYLIGTALSVYPDMLLAARIVQLQTNDNAFRRAVPSKLLPMDSVVALIKFVATGSVTPAPAGHRGTAIELRNMILAPAAKRDDSSVVFRVRARTSLYTLYDIPHTSYANEDGELQDYQSATSPMGPLQHHSALHNVVKPKPGLPGSHNTVGAISEDDKRFQDSVATLFQGATFIHWHSLTSLITPGTIPHMGIAQFVDTMNCGRINPLLDDCAADNRSARYTRPLQPTAFGPGNPRAFPPPCDVFGHAPPPAFMWLRYAYPAVLTKMHWCRRLTRAEDFAGIDTATIPALTSLRPIADPYGSALSCWHTHNFVLETIGDAYPIPPRLTLALEPHGVQSADSFATCCQLTNVIRLSAQSIADLPTIDLCRLRSSRNIVLVRATTPMFFGKHRNWYDTHFTSANMAVHSYLIDVVFHGIGHSRAVPEFRDQSTYASVGTAQTLATELSTLRLPDLRDSRDEALRAGKRDEAERIDRELAQLEHELQRHGAFIPFEVCVSNPNVPGDSTAKGLSRVMHANLKQAASMALTAIKRDVRPGTSVKHVVYLSVAAGSQRTQSQIPETQLIAHAREGSNRTKRRKRLKRHAAAKHLKSSASDLNCSDGVTSAGGGGVTSPSPQQDKPCSSPDDVVDEVLDDGSSSDSSETDDGIDNNPTRDIRPEEFAVFMSLSQLGKIAFYLAHRANDGDQGDHMPDAVRCPLCPARAGSVKLCRAQSHLSKAHKVDVATILKNKGINDVTSVSDAQLHGLSDDLLVPNIPTSSDVRSSPHRGVQIGSTWGQE